MQSVLSYFKALYQVAGYFGLAYLILSDFFLNPFALYFTMCCFLVALAGPIALSMKKDSA